MEFHIGQDIVCIKTHSLNIVKEGELHKVQSLQECPCKCGGVEIHVGIFYESKPSEKPFAKCQTCGFIQVNDGKHWLDSSLFRPLDELVNISELTSVLEKPLFEVNN